MTFKATEAEIGSGVFANLKDDGDSLTCIFLAEPEPITSKFLGQEKARAVFPVLTAEGLRAFSTGARVFRRLRDSWKDVHMKCVTITRHGARNSLGTDYDITLAKPNEKLLGIARKVKRQHIDMLLSAARGEHTTGEDVAF